MCFFKKICDRFKKHNKSLSFFVREAIEALKKAQEELIKEKCSVEKIIKKQVALAKKYATRDKQVTLQALDRINTLKRRLQKIDNILTHVQQQLSHLEQISVSNISLSSMKQASNTMKNTQNHTNSIEMAEIRDDLAKKQDSQVEIAQVIANISKEQFDEEELELELLQIREDEDNDVNLPDVSMDKILQKENDSIIKITGESEKAALANA